jgi:hypothetical protein
MIKIGKDVIVYVRVDSKPKAAQSRDILILATDEDFPYTEYRDLDVLANDFDITTKIYHKAYQLFNQPHTKASTLIRKVAVYGKEAASASDVVEALQELRETFDDWCILLIACDDDASQELDAV